MTYQDQYELDPISQDTIDFGNELLEAISETTREKWNKLIEGVDMTHKSKKAWCFIRKLNNDPKIADRHSNVTTNQIAHHLLQNGKASTKSLQKKFTRDPGKEVNHLDEAFTETELKFALDKLKEGKAAGFDNIRVEQLKRFGFVLLIQNCHFFHGRFQRVCNLITDVLATYF